MLTRTPKFWLITVILAVFATVQSLRAWRLKTRGQHAISDSDSLLANIVHPRLKTQAHSAETDHTNIQKNDINNATLGFQKIFAINLPSRTDKRDGLLLASKLSGFDVHFVNGVDPATISSKALPQKITGETPLPPGVVGCWRAHMNFLARVVQDDLSTALVLEDDVDWDVRLLNQLQEFGIMSKIILNPALKGRPKIKFEHIHQRDHDDRTRSPYGDGWDVLLLGNCGVDIDLSAPHVVRARDETVPDLNWLKIYGDPNGMRLNPHPSRARLVGRANDQTCTYAYAVTQSAARRLLLDLGLERLDKPFDLMLREWCEGKVTEQGPPRKCVGVLPSLFESYRREGSMEGDSDVDFGRYGRGNREKGSTVNIRKSVRMNLRQLLDGEGVDELEDQFPNFRFGGNGDYPERIGKT